MYWVYFVIQAILPFVLIPLSYLLFRWNRFKNERVYIYLLILFSAFLFDLMSISFRNQLFGLLFNFAVFVTLAQMIWVILRLKGRIVPLVLSSIAFSSYLLITIFWLVTAQPPESRMTTRQIDRYRAGEITYTLSRRLSRKVGGYPAYVFSLNRLIPATPFKKHLDSYVTPEGYFNSEYSVNWRETSEGVLLDLVADEDTLWSLGYTDEAR